MAFIQQGLVIVCILQVVCGAEPIASNSVDDAFASSCQESECGSDRSLLLQLPGVHVDPLATGGEYIDAELALEKGDKPNRTWHEHTKTMMKDMKMHTNAEGDLGAFMSSLALDSIIFLSGVAFFCSFRRRYPLVYGDNIIKGIAPKIVPDSCFGWIGVSWNLSFEDIEKVSGLDAAMFMEFVNLAIRLLLTIGVPMVIILCPLHHFLGGHPAKGQDNLSKLGMGNIVEGAGGRWLYWLHAWFVWYVVIMSQRLIFFAQEKFLERRYEWMLRMPKPRSTTVLVEGIPVECSTDAKLKAHFNELFPGDKVAEASVVRKTANLASLIDSYKRADQFLAEANFEWQAKGGTQDSRPQCRDSWLGKMVDKIDYYDSLKATAAEAVKKERQRLLDPENAAEVCSSSGFVTFHDERDAAIALSLKVRADEYVFMMSTPPAPVDVTYSDLYMDSNWLNLKAWLGYGCIFGIFLGFMPIILAISSIVNLTALRRSVPFVDHLVHTYPMSKHLLEGVLASGALTCFMSMLPTLFMLIFGNFFQLKAGRWSQHRLQIWYFWFQVIFVLLITAVGSSLFDTMVHLINHPTLIFELLADRLPQATHFYLNYMVMQWVLHAMNLTRYINLMKFKALCAMCEEERAKELSEPEDQDYYGIGGRSARFTLNLVVALVYCSLCPLMTVVTCINFLICKVVYSYLLVFAEGRKPDLGGHFWVTQLRHVQQGLFLYVVLMLGVLSSRAATLGPTVVVAPALVWLLRSWFRFQSAFEWEFMPFEEFVKGTSTKSEITAASSKSSRNNYVQPEFLEPVLD